MPLRKALTFKEMKTIGKGLYDILLPITDIKTGVNLWKSGER